MEIEVPLNWDRIYQLTLGENLIQLPCSRVTQVIVKWLINVLYMPILHEEFYFNGHN